MEKKVLLSILASLILFGNDDVVDLGQMSVIATKQEKSNLEQANAVSQKNEKEIELDQVIYQKELLNSLSGVRIEQTTSGIGHTTSVRMPNTTNGYYLFMQDGIPVQSSGFFNHNALAYTSYQNANDVEVLKGAGSVLYGSEAIAATINVNSLAVPKKDYSVSNSFGSYGTYMLKTQASDIIDDKNAYRANVSYNQKDGYREHTSYDRIEANFRYDYEINDENYLKLILNYTKTHAEQADSFNDYKYIEEGSKKASDSETYYDALEKIDVKRKFDFSRLSVDYSNYSYDNLEMVFTPYIRYNRNRYVATWESNLPSNDTKINTIGLLQRNIYDTNFGDIIFGFDSEYTDSSLKYNQEFESSVTSWGRTTTYPVGSIYDYDVGYKAIAPYINTRVELGKFELNFGARYDYNEFDYKNNLSTGLDDSGQYYRPDDRSDKYTHLSPKASLSYKIDDTTNLYFRYANSFRLPSATSLYSMKKGYEEVSLDSETSDTYEIGIKKEFTNNYFETNLYHMNIKDTISRITTSSGLYAYSNGGESVHDGLEITLNSKLSEDFSSKIALSYSKHSYIDDVTYGDNEMAGAPRELANFRLIYNPSSLSSLSSLTLMGEIVCVGKYYMDDSNTKEYEGYEIGNLKADYKINKSLNIFSKITNITDKKYAVTATSSWSDAYTPGDPREFYVGLEYKF